MVKVPKGWVSTAQHPLAGGRFMLAILGCGQRAYGEVMIVWVSDNV
jgi:hypothetical protein